MTISTADDDLRGGKDNLNIIVYFTNSGYQLAPDVNHGQNWPNNSTNTITITLNRPVPPNEISGLRLIHIPDGGFNLSVSPELATLAAPFVIAEAFQSPDNWNMGNIEIYAIGFGVNADIGHYGFHRFTGSNPALSIPIQAPANICPPGGQSGQGRLNPGLNPGGSGLRPVTGGGSRFGELTNQDVLRMISAGVPESEIIASIRRSPAKFDLTTNARAVLTRARVSQKIQDAMVVRMNTNGGKNEDDLNPQPYPPKGQLLNPGGQQTMLRPQANASAGTDSALVPAIQRSAITDGTTVNGGVPASVAGSKASITDGTFASGVRPAGTPQIGASQTMSATVPNSTNNGMLTRQVATVPSAQRSMSSLAMAAPATSVNLSVAAECAKSPVFRIVSVSSATLTVGPQYTLWGCSFGTQPNTKTPTPVSSSRQYTAQPANQEYAQLFVSAAGLKGAWFVKCNIQSWSDNAIVITLDPASAAYPGTGPSPIGQALPAQLWLTRADGQSEIWPREGGFAFKPVN